MTDPAFRLEGFQLRRLGADDAVEVQRLHERCTDHYELIEGGPTRPASAAEALAELPPGKTYDDKFYFGIHEPGGRLVGALEMARDLPSAGEWWLALLLLEPAARRRGLGARVLDVAKRWVGVQGEEPAWGGVGCTDVRPIDAGALRRGEPAGALASAGLRLHHRYSAGGAGTRPPPSRDTTARRSA
jgi:GNAT superfamily N-acetyltransferase